MKSKKCTVCHKTKPLSEFYLAPLRKGGNKRYYRSSCKDCYRIYLAVWRKENPDKKTEGERKWRIKKNFGITLEDYDRMFAEQKGLCKICGGSSPNKRLAIDHDHQTGKVRGLLCLRCNTKLGWYETLQINIMRYLDG